MKIGVLAVQGAFQEHRTVLARLGVDSVEIRKKEDLYQDMQGLILPGGESTVQKKLIEDLKLFQPLRDKISSGLPTLGTCAGLILLAQFLSNEESVHFGTLPVTVKRNAYGRQLGSFYTEAVFQDLGKIPMTFIRAPYIERVSDKVQVLAQVDEKIVGVRYENQIGIAFHPELDQDVRIHKWFVSLVKSYHDAV